MLATRLRVKSGLFSGNLPNCRIAFFLLVLLVVSGNLPAKPQDGQSFDNWTIRCEKAEGAKHTQCFVYQNLIMREGGQRVLHVAVGYLPENPSPVILITLPLGISLPPGIEIQVDEGSRVSLPIERCEPKGCRGGTILEDTLLSQFQEGDEVTITFHDSKRQPISVPLKLLGFSEALKSLQ